MQKSEHFTGRRYLLASVDAAVAVFAAWLTMRGEPKPLLIPLASTGATACVFALNLTGGYAHIMRKRLSVQQYCAGFAALVSISIVAVLLQVYEVNVRYGRIAVSGVVLLALLLSSRLGLIVLHRRLISRKRLWVVADDPLAARRFAAKVRNQDCWYEVHRCSGPVEESEVWGELEQFDAVMCPPAARPLFERPCSVLRKELLLVPDSSDVLLFAAGAQQVDDLLVLSMKPLELTTMQRVLKRALDIAGAAVLILFFAPVMAILYILIPLESPGSALFRQERRGRSGRSFQIIKFRSMRVNAEERSGPVLASAEDPRITGLGQWLRATRFDEFPQLLNVLRGEMSLVGPRPEREFFAQKFDRELPNYPLRTAIKPGLTGLAQVWGKYSTTAEDKLRLDLMYIANYSLSLDFNLLVQTVRVVLHHGQSTGLDPANRLSFGFHSVSMDKTTKL